MARVLMKGNEALGEGAVIAGCRYFFGYPITPQSEVAEYLARRLPQVDGVFLQAESEVAAINMVYGGSAAGARVMTGSSGPGLSLKQEGISFIAEAELPCVIANISRGGPGLGGIQPAQSDYFQSCKGGGHGDYRLIVLAPSSVQEMMDFALLAFDLADRYRTPVLIMSEGMLGQMMEPVQVREPVTERYEKPWATTGCINREPNIVNTLHLLPTELEDRNQHLFSKYARIAAEEKRAEMVMTEDAELVVVAYGLLSRVVKKAITEVRARGVKAGLIRPLTLWPFPDTHIQKCLDTAKLFLTIEISMGQMVEDVKLAVNGRVPVEFYGRIGVIPSPQEIERAIMAVAERGGLA
ncbi:MAG: 3-methyl-2-oxobutanoate dehydrogenase subunit VorB [Syntrophomonadaceae bacterium]|jgi:2-oxoglutarate ferredoxin oxidoreductase subunit alpha|nr:3-methyl-2-oxobutanoate dehydrogenase subunit VorB [Syntrophomonadaceae bacterium]